MIGPGVIGTITEGAGDVMLTPSSFLGVSMNLVDYGGQTETLALLPGSPAIASGSLALEVGPGGVPLTTDQRGLPFDSPTPDIGAFQSQGFKITLVSGGTPQSMLVGTAFSKPLAVTVTANNSVEPVSGGVVTYTVTPASNGETAFLSAAAATINSSGVAEVNATAGSTAGSYSVSAASGPVATPVSFSLVNQVQPSFSGLSDQTILVGTSTTVFSGTLASGSQAPVGDDVAVTLNGVTEQATIETGGAFSTQFNTASLVVAGSPYTVNYSYAGDGTFLAATGSSTLTVNANNGQQTTPTITWANPANITFGALLTGTQLDATASVAGTFKYTPPLNTILGAGAGQTLSVVFTPSNTTLYTNASATVTINVGKATPKITWPSPASISYGTGLTGTQLDASANVAGKFTYTPGLGAIGRRRLTDTFGVVHADRLGRLHQRHRDDVDQCRNCSFHGLTLLVHRLGRVRTVDRACCGGGLGLGRGHADGVRRFCRRWNRVGPGGTDRIRHGRIGNNRTPCRQPVGYRLL